MFQAGPPTITPYRKVEPHAGTAAGTRNLMRSGLVLLRTVAVVCTSLALTACVGPMTEEETAVEDEALASQTAAVGSCAGWSAWGWDGYSTTCGVRLSCGTYCDEFGNCGVNPASYEQEYSYRVCFDQYGNYAYTEYQYRSGSYLSCGC